uniref:F-box protein SKIP23 n=1 Tax=Anthurium amnicola TaxID=1678845 RepID=A0A1D1XE20_9ARAE
MATSSSAAVSSSFCSRWAALPQDVLIKIASLQTFPPDLFRFRSVCRSWRSAALAAASLNLLPHLPSPFLMFSDDADPHTRCFYSVQEDKVFRLRFPEDSRGWRCCGSSHGWLAMLGPDVGARLFHPFSGALLDLPPLTTLPGVRRLEEDDLCRSDAPKFEHQTQVTSCGMMFNMTVGAEVIRDVYVEKAVLAMDPSSDPGSTVVLLLLHDLAGLVYAKPGDQAWTVLPTPPGVDSFKDVVYHDGFFYGLSYNYEMVVTIDIFSGNRPIVEKYEQPVSEWTHCGGSYLVVVPLGVIGVILQVTRTTTRDSGPRRTVSFHVFAFVPGEVNKWVEVRALPGISLFLDGNCSTALYTSSVPGKSRSNCIYFGHDDRYPGYLHTTAFSDRDFGLFRLEDKAFERGFPAGVKMSTIKRPQWVMLSN